MNRIQIIILSIFIAFIALSGHAQNDIKVGISMGAINPLGEFKSSDNSNLNAGFSESGFALNFDGDFYVHHRIAVSARFNFGLTSIDKSKTSDWLDSNMFDYLNEKQENNLYSIDYWQWSSPMLGLKYNYPIVVNKLYFETGAFTGISIVQTPNQNLAILDETNEREIFSENIDSRSVAIPFMMDGGLRLKVNDNMEIELKSSYFQTKAEYEHVSYIVENESPEVNEELKRSTVAVPLKTITISFGIIYKL